MKMRSITVLLAMALMAGCSSKSGDHKVDDASYEKATKNLAEQEANNPLSFLRVTSKDKHNLIGQTVIKGTISNKAKVVTFKDVELELSFYSKTGVLLERDHETIYEKVAPGATADFKTKYFAPKGSDSVGIKITKAVAEKP